ncbi:hypothetical protein F3087_10495 [Nocardia colli]|uniref:Uncharacterized protein n=1 Tax=Nocardia colli TaxID=2545717 RepID=A0A5N0EMY2_9NOCA|nr:hypothetical protein [Nocardia colli]KAA8889355.1 hypothetical protein F3087_10495 [Nocardia colli]
MTESERTCWQAIARSGVIERLDQAGSLVAWEWLPRGVTHWYTAECREDLVRIVHALSPGCRVSFYFGSLQSGIDTITVTLPDPDGITRER